MFFDREDLTLIKRYLYFVNTKFENFISYKNEVIVGFIGISIVFIHLLILFGIISALGVNDPGWFLEIFLTLFVLSQIYSDFVYNKKSELLERTILGTDKLECKIYKYILEDLKSEYNKTLLKKPKKYLENQEFKDGLSKTKDIEAYLDSLSKHFNVELTKVHLSLFNLHRIHYNTKYDRSHFESYNIHPFFIQTRHIAHFSKYYKF